jgi:DNA helicase HerA-like ATPase
MSLSRISTSVENAAASTERHVGAVLSVRGAEVRVGILRDNQSSPDAEGTTVGKFLAIVSKNSILIGLVTEVSIELPEVARQQGYSASAGLDLMGEIKSDKTGAPRFMRGVTEYPLIGDPVVAIGSNELRVVYENEANKTINVGQLQQDGSLSAYVHVDEMLSRHFAVFGTSGVGKSSGIVLILQQVLKVRPNLRIFLLDAHNEYDRCFANAAQVLNPANLKLPFWLFNFEEMIDVIFGGRPGLEEETEILAELIPMAKGLYMQYRETYNRIGIKRPDSKSTGFTADTPVPYRLVDLLALIDDRMGKLENRSSRMRYHKLMTRIETVSNDPRYTFMFDNANVGGDTMAEVLCQLFRIPPNGKPMTIMQLAGFPAEVVDSVVSVLGRMAFELGMWSEGAFPMMFVCEEAHRYAAADRSMGFGPTRRALSRIAKEGRKYAIFLGIVSQRPAELDPTIISQCSTLFVMRMVNDRDQEIVNAAVSDAAANMISLLPSLGNREVLAFGEGVPLPARIAFAQLPEHFVPTSKVRSSNQAVAARSGQQEHIEFVVARWRGVSGRPRQPLPGETMQPPAPAPENVRAQLPGTAARERLNIPSRNPLSADDEAPVRPQRRIADTGTRWK